MRTLAVHLSIILAFAYTLPSVGQSYLQTPTFTQGIVDTIDLTTLNLQLTFPIIDKPGRGVKTSFAVSYAGNFWTSTGGVWSVAGGRFGWNFLTTQYAGTYSVRGYSESTCSPNDQEQDLVTTTQSERQYTDGYGLVHTFPGEDTYNECTDSESGYPAWASSGDGYTIDSASNVYDQHGNNVYSLTHVDQNGNSIVSGPDSRCNSTFGVSTCVIDTAGLAALGYDYTGYTVPSTIHYYYIDTSGTKQTITVTNANFTVQTNFGIPGISEYGPQTKPLPISIAYPYGTYTFTYESTPGHSGSVTGRIASVTLPTGGVISYTYAGNNNGVIVGVSPRTAGINRTTADGTIQFTSTSPASGTLQTSILYPSGRNTVYQFSQLYPLGLQNAYLTTQIVNNGQATSICYSGPGAGNNYQPFSCATTGISTPITQRQITTTLDNGLYKTVTESYNANSVMTEADITDFSASGPPVLEKNLYTYNTSFPNKFDRVSSIITEDAGSNIISQSQYYYDETTPVSTSGLPNHSIPSIAPGNLTRSSRWNSTDNTWLDTHFVYDDAGQIRSTSGPGPGQTSYSYESTDTFATTITYPTVGSITLRSQLSFDANSGRIMSQTDVNGHKLVFAYDSSLRLLSKTRDTGTGGDGAVTAYLYPSAQRTTIAATIGNGHNTDTEIITDAYGRQVRTATPTGQSPNAWFLSDTCFDSDDRTAFKSLPYASSSLTSSPICSGAGDATSYDSVGRLATVTHADGSQVLYAYKGRAIKVTDEGASSVHNIRALQSDGLGRLTMICEYSSGSSLVGSPAAIGCGTDINTSGADASATGYISQYSYNMAARSMTVSQTGAMRTWQYDSLGRPISEQVPERIGQATFGYSITSTGYVTTRKRVAPNQPWSTPSPIYVTTTTQLDALGRPISLSYDDNVTPSTNYTYDVGTSSPQSHNMLGGLASASVGPINQQFSYTSNGQIEWEQSCLITTCGLAQPTNVLQQFTYNLLGESITEADGASNVITQAYDSFGRLSQATESLQDPTHPSYLLSGMVYGPLGVSSANYGNGLAASMAYDSRGRMNGFQVGISGGANIYSFGVTIAPNGSVTHASDSQNDTWTYTYDEFNRLKSAAKDSGSLGFAYQYDIWGNRWSQSVMAGSGYSNTTSFDTSHGNHNAAYTYDVAGNVTSDGTNQYTYDPEGRVLSVNVQTFYTYGPDGSRVEVRKASGTKNYVYRPDGQLSSVWSGTNLVKANIYVGGSKEGFYDGSGTSFEYQDWTGSTRVVTNSTGSVTASYTSAPFGVINPLGTGSDLAQIAGMDWDSESLSGHAWARQYSPWSGSWFSPDPSNASYDFTNPQSLNRYTYVANDPMSYSDPLGLAREDDAPDPDASSVNSAIYGNYNASTTQIGCQPGDVDVCRGVVKALKWLGSFLGSIEFGGGSVESGGLNGLESHEFQQDFHTSSHIASAPAQQQNQYGKQPDGSYKADPAAVKKAIAGGKAIGSGECVALCRFLSGAPNSGTWTAGQHAAGLTDADIGTAIATFDSTGHYPSDNDPLGKNSAIFMGRGTNGSIWVVDQWPVGDGPPGTHQPFLHEIRNYAPDNNVHPLRSNNADAYYVIRVP